MPLSRTFRAGALHSGLLHQAAPRVAAPSAGARSSIVRDDGYLRHWCLAFSNANRLCRGNLQSWELLWLCFLSSSQVVPAPTATATPYLTCKVQSAAGRLPLGACRWGLFLRLSHGSEPVSSNSEEANSTHSSRVKSQPC